MNSFDFPVIENYKAIFLKKIPLLDVRADIEFIQGAFPNVQNIPLMNNDERKRVGICYKKYGQMSAIELGKQLVSRKIKKQRIQLWKKFVEKNPQGALYCFRGGLRSKITQEWIYEATGVLYPRILGGYKALRRYLINQFESIQSEQMIILGGKTGTGKTLLLQQLPNTIDLEGLANHRGSAFGPNVTPQPSQINFENFLAIELLTHKQQKHHLLVFEDEGRNVGCVHIPIPLRKCLDKAPVIVLETSEAERIQISLQEYIINMEIKFNHYYGKLGFQKYREYLLGSLQKIKKRLGDLRYQELQQIMLTALDKQEKTGEINLHIAWIKEILTNYYDPMYAYQLEKKKQRIIFSGNKETILRYLKWDVFSSYYAYKCKV